MHIKSIQFIHYSPLAFMEDYDQLLVRNCRICPELLSFPSAVAFTSGRLSTLNICLKLPVPITGKDEDCPESNSLS